MPRKPTGNPRGRPKGTGHLTAPQRLTLWLDGALFAQLEAYAEGRHFHRGTPELAGCVRELLARALSGTDKQQTRNVPHRGESINKQITNVPDTAEHNNEQIVNFPAMAWNNNKQTENVLTAAEAGTPVPVALPAAVEPAAVPDFDHTTYRLSRKLCKGGHEYGQTGKTLVTIGPGQCQECIRETMRRRRQAKREAAAQA